MKTKKVPNRANGGLARSASLTKERKSEIASHAAVTRWGRKSKFRGTFLEEFGIDADCYVLDDDNGTAVLTQRGIMNLLGYTGSSGNKFKQLVFRPYIKNSLGSDTIEKLENPIKFQCTTAGPYELEFRGHGLDATVLIDICNAVVKAYQNGEKIRNTFANNARVILSACAKTGIRELIYKLAGYDSTKEQVINAFKQFVSEEAHKWAKEFPDDLYASWQRLYNIQPPERGRSWKHKHLTMDFIYWPLAKSNGRLIDLLREARGNQKNAKLHQFLTDVGTSALREQITRTLAIAQASDTKEQYERLMSKINGGQIPLSLESDS